MRERSRQLLLLAGLAIGIAVVAWIFAHQDAPEPHPARATPRTRQERVEPERTGPMRQEDAGLRRRTDFEPMTPTELRARQRETVRMLEEQIRSLEHDAERAERLDQTAMAQILRRRQARLQARRDELARLLQNDQKLPEPPESQPTQ